MEKFKVSVIMGAYNEKVEWIELAINSILNQTYKNLEFIIILDNPDNLKLREYLLRKETEEKRLRIVVNEKNIGLVKTLNKAMDLTTGDYIARMDADDIALENRIEIQMNRIINDSNIKLLGGGIRFIGEDNEDLGEDNYRPKSFKEVKNHLKHWNAFAHPTMIYSKEAILTVGKYREIECAEDYDLVTRFILAGYKIENIDEVVLKYRIRKNGISQSNKAKQFLVSEEIKNVYINNLKGINYKFNDEKIKQKLDDKSYCNKIERYIDSKSKSKFQMLLNSFYDKKLLGIFMKDSFYKLFKF